MIWLILVCLAWHSVAATMVDVVNYQAPIVQNLFNFTTSIETPSLNLSSLYGQNDTKERRTF